METGFIASQSYRLYEYITNAARKTTRDMSTVKSKTKTLIHRKIYK